MCVRSKKRGEIAHEKAENDKKMTGEKEENRSGKNIKYVLVKWGRIC